MLAIATLAAGFVVAAVTPSHAADGGSLDDLRLSGTVGQVDHLAGQDGLSADQDALGQE